MAAMITVVCPECSKAIQAPPEFVGKKVRCKSCGQVFVAKSSPPPGAVARPQPVKAATGHAPPQRPVDDEEGDDGTPYQVSSHSLAARCPECANEMESEDAIVCLHCGYNTVTRERHVTRKVQEVTDGDRVVWLLPGIACAVAVFLLIILDTLYCVFVTSRDDSGVIVAMFASKAVKMWICIGSTGLIFLAGRFAILRLVFHPNPPEVEDK